MSTFACDNDLPEEVHERLQEVVIEAAAEAASAALNASEGINFLRHICGWTQGEIEKALST